MFRVESIFAIVQAPEVHFDLETPVARQCPKGQIMPTRRTPREQIRVVVVPLRGTSSDRLSVAEAIETLENYPEVSKSPRPSIRYEVHFRYRNGDNICGFFDDQQSSIDFLRTFRPPAPRSRQQKPGR
jgi:hypothetical protein